MAGSFTEAELRRSREAWEALRAARAAIGPKRRPFSPFETPAGIAAERFHEGCKPQHAHGGLHSRSTNEA